MAVVSTNAAILLVQLRPLRFPGIQSFSKEFIFLKSGFAPVAKVVCNHRSQRKLKEINSQSENYPKAKIRKAELAVSLELRPCHILMRMQDGKSKSSIYDPKISNTSRINGYSHQSGQKA
jgi:hypothetical protein